MIVATQAPVAMHRARTVLGLAVSRLLSSDRPLYPRSAALAGAAPRAAATAVAPATATRRRPRRRGSRRGLLALTVLALSLLGSTGTWAYFTGSGSGSGTAGTGTTVPMTLTPGTVSASLYPGGSASVVFTVSNPNLSPIYIGTFVLDTSTVTSGFAINASHSGCSTASLTFTAATAGWTVPAKSGSTNGSLAVTLPGALNMAPDAASACQGATITVYLAADYLQAN